MNRYVFRGILTLSLLFSSLWGSTASAQSFQGLDDSSSTTSKSKKKATKKKKHAKSSKTAAKPLEPVPPAKPAPAVTVTQPGATPAATGSATKTVPAGAAATSGKTATVTTTGSSAPPPTLIAPKPTVLVPPPAAGASATVVVPVGAAPAAAATAVPPPPPPKPAPVMTFEAVDVSGKSSERQKLEVAAAQFRAGDYETSALTSYEIMTDPKYADLALEARYLLAKTLYRMGLYHSSLGEFSKVLEKGPDTKLFRPSLEWLFFISHKTTNETVILDEIAKYSNTEFPERFRNEFRYLLARYYFVRGRALDQVDQKTEANQSFEQVMKLTASLPRISPFYPRAKYLEALSLFRDSKMDQALDALREVVKLTRPGLYAANQQKELADLRDLAFMQLARTHYGARQNRNAIYYYNKIERGRPQWLDALFEAAWGHYRIGQYEQALGNLITLSSPYFRTEYFPEALILKAVIYYENCRYREALSILRDFEHTYLPVQQELDLLVKKDMDSSEYYTVLAEVQRKNASGAAMTSTDIILERVLKLALTDRDLFNTNSSILELEDEIENLTGRGDTFKYSELTKNLLTSLKSQREDLIKKAGIMAKGKLTFELEELTRLLGNGERIKFETTTQEKEFLEEQLQEGGRTAIVKKYKYSVATADDELYWPFEGEYWRDELGTYQYTLTKGCVERDTANRRRE
jgi:tetratricopeptide (TPR) repeat protein